MPVKKVIYEIGQPDSYRWSVNWFNESPTPQLDCVEFIELVRGVYPDEIMELTANAFNKLDGTQKTDVERGKFSPAFDELQSDTIDAKFPGEGGYYSGARHFVLYDIASQADKIVSECVSQGIGSADADLLGLFDLVVVEKALKEGQSRATKK